MEILCSLSSLGFRRSFERGRGHSPVVWRGGVCISADTVKRAVVLESKLGDQRKVRRLIPQRAGLRIQESMDLPAAARGTKDTI